MLDNCVDILLFELKFLLLNYCVSYTIYVWLILFHVLISFDRWVWNLRTKLFDFWKNVEQMSTTKRIELRGLKAIEN